jgi:hypothetical protein
MRLIGRLKILIADRGGAWMGALTWGRSSAFGAVIATHEQRHILQIREIKAPEVPAITAYAYGNGLRCAGVRRLFHDAGRFCTQPL